MTADADKATPMTDPLCVVLNRSRRTGFGHYAAGFLAALADRPMYACPLPAPSKVRDCWLRGWVRGATVRDEVRYGKR